MLGFWISADTGRPTDGQKALLVGEKFFSSLRGLLRLRALYEPARSVKIRRLTILEVFQIVNFFKAVLVLAWTGHRRSTAPPCPGHYTEGPSYF